MENYTSEWMNEIKNEKWMNVFGQRRFVRHKTDWIVSSATGTVCALSLWMTDDDKWVAKSRSKKIRCSNIGQKNDLQSQLNEKY